MRETRTHGSEGGEAQTNEPSLPLFLHCRDRKASCAAHTDTRPAQSARWQRLLRTSVGATLAADDVADASYPKFKAALAILVKKIFLRDRGAFSVISSSPNKATSSQSLIFSVYSETKIKRRVKFVFHQELSEIEYEECVEQIFVTLREHHFAEGDDDRISHGITDVSDLRAGEVYLLYNAETSRWEIVDPIKETIKWQSGGNENAT